jgi:hypothetical protein
MKISIDVDLSPDELRRLFGLPDFSPVQELLMERLTKQVESGLEGNLLPGLMRAAISGGMQSFEAYQKFVGSLMNASSGTGGRSASSKEDDEAPPDAEAKKR